MHKTSKNKSLRNYSVDYRDLYGRDIFSASNEDKFFDGDFEEESGFIKKESTDESKKEKKEVSFQHVFKYVLRKTMKILVTSVVISVAIILITVILGVVMDVEKREKLISFDNLIWPVVMQDPEPFSQECPLNTETMLKVGVWDASCHYKMDKVLFDKDGRQIILGKDVRESVRKIFNVDIDVKESIPDGMYFFNYDISEDKFYVEPINKDQYFTPHTKSYEDMENNLTKLTVEYLVPQSQYDEVAKKSKERKVEKVMQYILKEDERTKNKYIFKICNV